MTGSVAPAKTPATIKLASAATRALFIVSNLLNLVGESMPVIRFAGTSCSRSFIRKKFSQRIAEAYFDVWHYMKRQGKASYKFSSNILLCDTSSAVLI